MFSADSTQVVSSSPTTPQSLWTSTSNNDNGAQGLNVVTGSIATVQKIYPASGAVIGGHVSPNAAPAQTTNHGFFIKADGSLWAVGNNGSGQLGVGANTAYQAIPVFVDAGPWVWAAGTDGVSAGIKADGTLWTWGRGSNGVLGHNDVLNCVSPVIVGARTDWVRVHCMVNSMVALRSDNTMWGWGSDQYGQLGQGAVAKTNKSSPVQIAGSWAVISCTSQGTTYGIRTDGSLWSWGRGSNGALGLNIAQTISRSSPVQIGTATDWVDINPIYNGAIARKSNGQLWSWGFGTSGQLGNNSNLSRSSPVQVAFGGTPAFAGSVWGYDGVIIDTSGNAWTWGQNTTPGSLWDATSVPRSSPVQVGTGYVATPPQGWSGSASKVPLQIASLAIKTNGDMVYSATGNYFNVLGVRGTQPTTTVYGTSPVWASGKMSVGVYGFSSGGDSCFAIKSDGTLWSWGNNSDYQLGLGDLASRSSPVQIGTGTWSQVSGGWRFAGGVKTDGTLWMWGLNNSGALGNGVSTGSAISPLQIGSLTNWSSIACSKATSSMGSAVLAIKTDGTLWAWGSNDTYQLGTGTNVSRSSPVQIGALTNWKQASINGYQITDSEVSSLAVKTDGTLWSWGSGVYGSLGHNNTNTLNSPTQVGTLTNWAKVSVGPTGVVAVKTDGTLWTWGRATYGENGDGTNIARSSPVQVGALTDWVDCARGNSMTVGLRSNGTLWAWGNNVWIPTGTQYNNNIYSSPVQISAGTSTGTTGWKSLALGSASYNDFMLMLTKE